MLDVSRILDDLSLKVVFLVLLVMLMLMYKTENEGHRLERIKNEVACDVEHLHLKLLSFSFFIYFSKHLCVHSLNELLNKNNNKKRRKFATFLRFGRPSD